MCWQALIPRIRLITHDTAVDANDDVSDVHRCDDDHNDDDNIYIDVMNWWWFVGGNVKIGYTAIEASLWFTDEPDWSLHKTTFN